ncbi:DNA polymerase IV [hydrothermal vent metagenome]|uniref:DNA-directed DNA polymerase n=1 Tax=hydrothermal vent metagenome TaxID=652676 RepID=A0A3B0Z1A8_9ZZZZ
MSMSERPQRWIAHMDLDAFFASCEQRQQPQYKGLPVVVGALPGRRGVVAAASYEARRFGIHSAMPISEAYRRCPNAVYLRPDIEKYYRASQQVFKVLGTITPSLEAASIDEAYLDVSGLDKLLGTPEMIGAEIKRRILAETGLTASVGIGPNRLIAKLGSEHRKPDGLMVIPPDQVLDFLAPMPVANLRGLGCQTQKIFKRLGIRTVTQLRTIPLQQLEKHLGKNAAGRFYRQALGMASDEITPGRTRKSLSKETTFEEDVQEHTLLRDTLRELAAYVAKKARRESLSGSVITLKIRYKGFETRTRQHKLPAPCNDERDIFKTAWGLFTNGDLPKKPVRLIGVSLSSWQDNQPAQTDLFDIPGQHQGRQQLLETLDAVSEKFGDGLLQIGISRKATK